MRLILSILLLAHISILTADEESYPFQFTEPKEDVIFEDKSSSSNISRPQPKPDPEKEITVEIKPDHDYVKESQDYWALANYKANKLYGGFDLSAKIKGGLESRQNELGSNHGPYGAIEFTIPLYDRDKRESVSSKKKRFLDDVAKSCRQLTESGRRIFILKEKAKIIKGTLQNGGLEAIDAYFNIQEEIIKSESEVSEARRLLDAATGKRSA